MVTKEVRGVEYVNLSDQALGRVISWLPQGLQAKKVVFLPDLGPSRAPLPTGSHVVVEERDQPSWRHLALSDVGCGMQVLKLPLSWTDFNSDLGAWDELHRRLKANKGKLGDLGSGNHFLDAAVDEEEQVYLVTHTGSRNESPIAEKLVDHPQAFDKRYPAIVNWARDNRDQIRREVEGVYQDTATLVLDKAHNFFERKGNEVLLYKGSMKLEPGELGVIPSSMAGEMALVEGTEAGTDINFALAHGTGRIKSRSANKIEGKNYDFAGLREKIYIPQAIPDASLITDNPDCYRGLDQCLDLLGDLVKVVKRLIPIAYLGQI